MRTHVIFGFVAALCILGVSCEEEVAAAEAAATETAAPKEKICEPSATFMEDCNTCKCSDDGTDKACTKQICLPGLKEGAAPEGEGTPQNLPVPEADLVVKTAEEAAPAAETETKAEVAQEATPEASAAAPAEEAKPEEPSAAAAEEAKPEEPSAAPAEEAKPEEPSAAPAEEAKAEPPAVAKDRRRRRDTDDNACEPGKSFMKNKCLKCYCPHTGRKSLAHMCSVVAC